VKRYNQNGTIDTTFGIKGEYITNFEKGKDYPTSIALQNDGKVVIAGYFRGEFGSDFMVTRYNIDGLLDTTFGVWGRKNVDLGDNSAMATCVTMQTDGKIIIAGGLGGRQSGSNFAAVRLLPKGELDETFGRGRKINYEIIWSSSMYYFVIITKRE